MKSLVKLFLVTCIALGFVACQDDDKDTDNGGIRVTGTTVSMEPIPGGLYDNIEEVVLDPTTNRMTKTITIKASEPVAQDVDVWLQVLSFGDGSEIVEGADFTTLPKDYYEVKQNAVTIKAGTTEATWTIDFKKLSDELWDQTETIYALPVYILDVSQLSSIDYTSAIRYFTFDLTPRDVVHLAPDLTERYTQIITKPSAAGETITLNVMTTELSQRNVEVNVAAVTSMKIPELTAKVKELYGDENWPRSYALLPSDCYEITPSTVNIAEGTDSAPVDVLIKELPQNLLDSIDYYVLPVQISGASYGAVVDYENEADTYYVIIDIPKNDFVWVGSNSSEAAERVFIVDSYTSEGGNYKFTVPVSVGTVETPNQSSTVTIESLTADLAGTFYSPLDNAYFTLNSAASTSPTTVDFTMNDHTSQTVNVEVTIPDTFFDADIAVHAIPLKITGTSSATVVANEAASLYTILLMPPTKNKAYINVTKGQWVTMDIDATIASFQPNKTITLEGFISVSDNATTVANQMFNIVHKGASGSQPYGTQNGIAILVSNAVKNAAAGGLYINMFGSNKWVIANANSEGKVVNPIEKNKWYHIAVVVEDDSETGVKVYVNGVLICETFVYGRNNGKLTSGKNYDDFDFAGELKKPTGPNPEDFIMIKPQVIGGNTAESQAAKPKKLAEMRVWKTARTQAQIRSTMYDVPAAELGDLVYYVKFDGGTPANAAGNGMGAPIVTGTPTYGTEAIGLGSPSTF